MQKNIDRNLTNLRNRALQKRLSLNAQKSKEDCETENTFFEYLKMYLIH